MPTNRRDFIRNTTLAGSALALGSQNMQTMATDKPGFPIPAAFKVIILATNWGFQGTYDEFCARAKASGYDGVEIWLPGTEAQRQAFFEATAKHGLQYGFLAAGSSPQYPEHFAQFTKSVEAAAAHKPLFINCHSGRDHFSFEQNKAFIDFTTALTHSTGVPIYHETHRSRILFAAHIARQFIEKIPDLRLTLDISHWCNVHESLLQDQPETVQLALSRTDHIHSRVGFEEGPQINEPRAPEWKNALDAHLPWWDKVVEIKIQTGSTLTMTTEFGPPNYMPALPYTRQPVADLWEVNAWMKDLWRERYRS